jgi:hypothetical protein
MIRPLFSSSAVNQLLSDSIPQRKRLEKIYSGLPQSRCQRQTRCCSFLPEMTWIEVLPILDHLRQGEPFWRKSLIEKIIRYFFINPVEIVGCPFLEARDCIIYADRAFGCRAYGLWSPEYYQDLVNKNIEIKKTFQQEWQKLGVALPSAVLNYNPPYCGLVHSGEEPVSDKMLARAYQEIETLSQNVNPWHRFFAEDCFCDLSFFLARWIYGSAEAVRLKYLIVRGILQENNRGRLDWVLNKLFDPFVDRGETENKLKGEF